MTEYLRKDSTAHVHQKMMRDEVRQEHRPVDCALCLDRAQHLADLENGLRVIAASLESEARVVPQTLQAERLRVLAAKARGVVER
jgi:hypothetical protein